MNKSKKFTSIHLVYIGFLDMGIHNLLWGISELELDCRAYDIPHCIADDPDEYEKLLAFIKEAPTDIVISQNFSPTVSNVCNTLSIPYAAWTYDMPLSSLHHKSVFNPCNFIFSFDRDQALYLKNKGVANVYHLPLAANISRSATIDISAADEKKYSCDVSFVGNVLHKRWKDLYNDYLRVIPENESLPLLSLVNDSTGIWDGKNRIREALTPELLSLFKKYSHGNSGIDEKVYYEAIISYHVSSLEREQMLRSLLPFNVFHYAQTGFSNIEGLNSLPSVSYDNELQKVYFLSKINMSITLHTISSGVPLRVFDILGMCSFCLTNYQPEIEELFDIGKEIVIYHNLEEIPGLVNYYLHHEYERLEIAVNGYRRVSSCYTWAKGVEKILDTIL